MINPAKDPQRLKEKELVQKAKEDLLWEMVSSTQCSYYDFIDIEENDDDQE
jgi:hypothetical protein